MNPNPLRHVSHPLRDFFEEESHRETVLGYPPLTEDEINELVIGTIKRIPICMGTDTVSEYANRWFRERRRNLQDFQI